MNMAYFLTITMFFVGALFGYELLEAFAFMILAGQVAIIDKSK